jgi:hypothetical protein
MKDANSVRSYFATGQGLKLRIRVKILNTIEQGYSLI